MLPKRLVPSEISRLADPRLLREYAYIDGRWRGAADGAAIAVHDPADGEVLGSVARLGAAEAREAVAAAKAAWPAWRALAPQARAALIRAWHDAILANREDLARLMTLEQGKPIAEARGEIDYAASFVAWYAEETKRLNVESVTSHLPEAEMIVRREPIGVAALVTPWNFPSAMITRKAAAALAAGCTVVVHPSMETPLSALALAELAERAGLPAGVFNVVTGEAPEIVEAWCAEPDVRLVSFTGSTEIGRKIAALCAPGVKRLVLELGGHAPFIVFPDADLETAVAGGLAAKFATSGQDCLAANRFYLHRDIHDRFVGAFAAGVRALKVGPGLDEDSDIGPLIHERALAKCEAQVEDALARGARLLVGGRRHKAGPLFYEPTVLVDVPADARIMREETFGPVAAFARFDDEAAVLAAANDTEYGLAAYLYTEDYRRISRMGRALEYGMVAVNRAKITGAPIPFGGVKQSGLGREGARHGMEAFTEIKYLCLDAA
ncbi:MAG TPA: NAD-dependent succinate-semialdehyde dehydrogenase [Kiloniellales bacterium]|nr:NAD-dependent succinate-semialdehyde dehydrogenase [Kiloniellales bacterium]